VPLTVPACVLFVFDLVPIVPNAPTIPSCAVGKDMVWGRDMVWARDVCADPDGSFC
jgi:hypothetical protein